jgi:hypothetical protein
MEVLTFVVVVVSHTRPSLFMSLAEVPITVVEDVYAPSKKCPEGDPHVYTSAAAWVFGIEHYGGYRSNTPKQERNA